MAATNQDPRGRVGFLPPPPGETPNFDHPQDIYWTLNVAVLIVCNVLATVSFCLRCYVRLFVHRRILVADLAHYGLGYHAWEITAEDYSQVLKWLYASSIVYIPAAYFTKVTLLLLIAHVFAVNERIAKSIHVFIWVLLFMYTPVQTIKTTICVPIEDYWLPSVSPRCINQRKVFIVDTSIAVFVDLVILVLPIFMTWSLTMSPKKKFKIMLMLGAGGGATAATVFRLVTAIRFVDSPDLTVSFVIIDLTACVTSPPLNMALTHADQVPRCIELTIGLVCACLPSVNVLFKRHQSVRERARSFNVPRTGRFGGLRQKELSSLWETVTGKTRTLDTATVAVLEPETPPQSAVSEVPRQLPGLLPLPTFSHDFVSFPGHLPEESLGAGLVRLDSRVNSSDGRTDGWLSPRTEGDVERARLNVPGTRLWSTIWDGRSAEIPQK
ncbi:Integral membrane protein [Colletotrichum higginsianum IMI 349063]|uniref:Integral membrane protein n=1 Tax=Colletotrichum higginsianum (strain IMI 349063) TaxID=759273 RepID=A0A1B7Y0W4_COLHI|nr:Integral membrane protein [Colletotrichum higginsianum IMI 349063]OBR05658.1 Integral membrane protein [Colletotrichum higginsianum IMI 349063]GJD04055.1 integral membrane protein [Colletotrichum higginsianum]